MDLMISCYQRISLVQVGARNMLDLLYHKRVVAAL